MSGRGEKQPAVSLIIPVYNTGDYLHRCLESALRQTLQDMEIIAVDDGSDDGSQQVLDDCAARHPGRLTVVHQPNAGVSAARNRGLDLARGTYVAFLDGDDCLTDTFCEKLLTMALRERAQICKGTCFKLEVGNDGRTHLLYAYSQYLSVLRSRLCFSGDMFTAMYRQDYLRKHSIRFDEDLIFCEDALFLHQAVLSCRCLAVDDTAVYLKCSRPGSAVHGLMSSRKVHDAIRVVRDISASLRCSQASLDEPGLAHSWLSLEMLLAGMIANAADAADAAAARSCTEQLIADCPCPQALDRLRAARAALQSRTGRDPGQPQKLVLRS